ncbi:MAG: hypothetical protein Ta2B_26240 [Termitinemataceae bacterium]|nr:MAG: hypothetical protein Ta2B_26240 [Termitinemataceae bacterium]
MISIDVNTIGFRLPRTTLINARNKRFFCLLIPAISLFLMLFVTAQGLFAQTYDKGFYFNRARQQINQGKYVEALNDLNTVIKLDPNDVSAYNTRGVAFEKCGDFKSAMADYQTAYKLNPNAAETMHNIESLGARTGMPATTPDGTPLVSAATARSRANVSAVKPRAPARTPYISHPSTQPVQETTRITVPPPVSSSMSGKASVVYAPPVVPTASNVQSRALSAAPQKQVRFEETAHYSAVSARPPTNDFYANRSPDLTESYIPIENMPIGQSTTTYYVKGFRVSTYTMQTSYANTSKTGSIPSRNIPDESLVQVSNSTVRSSNGYYETPRTQNGLSASAAYSSNNQSAGAPVLSKIYVDPAAEKYNDIGVTLCNYGKYKDAIEEFDKALGQYKDFAVAYNNRGAAYALLGNSQNALLDFNQALRINPYYFDAQENRRTMKEILAEKNK